jgi:pyruvate/2-oxoglutarate dehydrogenase complex dihydrolipoamide dehydrogenase (E3) component
MAQYELAVIGAGAAGIAAATYAARKGVRTCLVVKEAGALHNACIPSRKLLHAARTLKSAGEFGVDIEANTARLMNRCKEVGEQARDAALKAAVDSGVALMQGEASFLSPRDIKVGENVLTAASIIIATGSKARVPDVQGIVGAGYLLPETLFSLKRLPGTLAIIGGGPSGVELSQALARLGCKVTLFEKGHHILPAEDEESAAMLRKALEGEGVRVHDGTTVLQASRYGRLRSLVLQKEGRRSTLEFDELLACAGRLPAIDGLMLDKAGVRSYGGGILVDDRLTTSQRHIYAAGDVIGNGISGQGILAGFMGAGAAEHQGQVAVDNVIGGRRSVMPIPRVIHTDPVIAAMGIRDEHQGERKASVHAAFVKVYTTGGTVVGCSIVGESAPQLAQLFALAAQEGIAMHKVGMVAQPYPLGTALHSLTQDDRGALRRLFSR